MAKWENSLDDRLKVRWWSCKERQSCNGEDITTKKMVPWVQAKLCPKENGANLMLLWIVRTLDHQFVVYTSLTLNDLSGTHGEGSHKIHLSHMGILHWLPPDANGVSTSEGQWPQGNAIQNTGSSRWDEQLPTKFAGCGCGGTKEHCVTHPSKTSIRQAKHTLSREEAPSDVFVRKMGLVKREWLSVYKSCPATVKGSTTVDNWYILAKCINNFRSQ